jgi:2-polyprenyl-6-methoxyphenol hydroxylase-like FAD-dependent oxidoreductase
MVSSNTQTRCVIAGGGPAGIMVGYLLAHAGIDVIVLEKHGDFLRDFRGDTIHPSTLQVMDELGLLDDFLARPHDEIRYAAGEIGDALVRIADLTHLPTRCKFIAFMPQWDFLNFLAGKARAFPNFRLLMDTEAIDLLHDGDRVAGLCAKGADGKFDIYATLTIAADGRHSRLRDAAEFTVENLGAPMDVLWFRLGLRENDTAAVLGRIVGGAVLVRLFRGDYWQCALIIRKGTFDDVKSKGIEAFRARVAQLAKRENADEISSWGDVRLLTVAVDRLPRWYTQGLLFIGDAAHAMSPIGGVGINLAIQDAVAAANILVEPLRNDSITMDDLARVQRRRWFPTWATQKMQTAVQNAVIDPILDSANPPPVPAIAKLAQRWTWLQRIPARLIGIGVRPEHVSRALLAN